MARCLISFDDGAMSFPEEAGEHGIPWQHCGGRGRQALQHSTEQALLLAARRQAP